MSFDWQPWLTHTKSLTEKLEALTDAVELQVLYHQFDPASQILHREILMKAQNIPCWYAKTLIPEQTLHADVALFEGLKTTPLGVLIYPRVDVVRIKLHAQKITPESSEWSWLNPLWIHGASMLWMRTSEFRLQEQYPFYLFEILLPGLECFA